MRKYRWLEQLHIKHYKTLLQLAQYRLYCQGDWMDWGRCEFI